MLVILRIRGYRLWFYEVNLAEPPHAHAGKKDKEAKCWMDPIALPKLYPEESMILPESMEKFNEDKNVVARGCN